MWFAAFTISQASMCQGFRVIFSAISLSHTQSAHFTDAETSEESPEAHAKTSQVGTARI